jgi:hypothetical protein
MITWRCMIVVRSGAFGDAANHCSCLVGHEFLVVVVDLLELRVLGRGFLVELLSDLVAGAMISWGKGRSWVPEPISCFRAVGFLAS